MYIDNENFEKWMEKLSKKLTEIGKDLKSFGHCGCAGSSPASSTQV